MTLTSRVQYLIFLNSHNLPVIYLLPKSKLIGSKSLNQYRTKEIENMLSCEHAVNCIEYN